MYSEHPGRVELVNCRTSQCQQQSKTKRTTRTHCHLAFVGIKVDGCLSLKYSQDFPNMMDVKYLLMFWTIAIWRSSILECFPTPPSTSTLRFPCSTAPDFPCRDAIAASVHGVVGAVPTKGLAQGPSRKRTVKPQISNSQEKRGDLSNRQEAQ